jgi:uncharacterized protein
MGLTNTTIICMAHQNAMIKVVFVDTAFWISLFDRTDIKHPLAVVQLRELEKTSFLTTDTVLTEVMNYFSKTPSFVRIQVTGFVKGIMLDEKMRVLYSTRALLVQSIDFYEQRADKQYSLTDCMSMLVMRERSIFDVLTSDKHFRQEGFNVLMADS